MTNDFLSIIVPTSSGRIPWSLLHSIKEQSLDSNNYEIILVFNKKKAPTNVIPWPNVRFLFSPICGVNHARNLGLVHAIGNVLLFLDDDCTLQNTDYLSQHLKLHREHPEQKSIGGPYVLNKTASLAAQAYDWNRTQWLRTHQLGQWHSQVLLGGNASYKKSLFADGLRFPPGIVYGGSETPLNIEIYQKHGPHLFLQTLAVEHASQLSIFSFFKKAYLQGKGWAFQKKFHQQLPANETTLLVASHPLIAMLIYFYNFIFMIGYRTSIFERRFWARSAVEEVFFNLLRPVMHFVQDSQLAYHVAKTEYFPFMPAERKTAISPIGTHESLFAKLRTMSRSQLTTTSFSLQTTVCADKVFLDLLDIANFYCIIPENLSFAESTAATPQFLVHQLNQGVIVFDPAVSDHYKTWDKQRLEQSKIKTLVHYLAVEDVSIYRKAWPHVEQKKFYPLDNVFIDTATWNTYISSTPLTYNHFSWNYFLSNNPISTQHNTTKIALPLQINSLMNHAKTYFLNSPQRAFFKTNYVLLGSHWKRRSLLLRLAQNIQKYSQLIPQNWMHFFTAFTQGLQAGADHWNIEAHETSSILYKWTACSIHRLYWTANKLYWLLYTATTFTVAQIIWRSFDALLFVYMFLNSCYWFLYTHFIGHIIGFLRSLSDEPEYFQQLPTAQRYKQRLLLILRKWGWLLLRGVRLR